MLQKINAQIVENYGQFEDQLKNQRKYMDNYQNQEMNGDWTTKDQNYEEEEIKSELEEFIKQEIQNDEEQDSDYDFLSSDNDGEAYVSSEGEDSNYEITDSSDYEDEK
ncbi:hypothetical protein PPERSA_02107 [Pseudocohnilembus persalinus]|uniref:Uncharacterized protein n=1 Tax=Pseudocohnilembus persalinus TaxID=266149 RepID=A0A0V0Q839_PSEPJ|nr:hypothetical protein PPERSA_02107 [Pseudocohnilembus persalinus]|eukprot:KRW98330.1 hypothetical protein PPERSA_02107 [Pseudocohnilembus persalinus]